MRSAWSPVLAEIYPTFDVDVYCWKIISLNDFNESNCVKCKWKKNKLKSES